MIGFVVGEGDAAVGASPGDRDQPGAVEEAEERTSCPLPRTAADPGVDSCSQKATWNITLAPKTFIGGVARVVVISLALVCVRNC